MGQAAQAGTYERGQRSTSRPCDVDQAGEARAVAQEAGRAVGRVHGNGDLPKDRGLAIRDHPGLTDARRDRGLRSIRRVGGETPVLIYPSPRRGDHRRLEQALRGTPGGVQG